MAVTTFDPSDSTPTASPAAPPTLSPHVATLLRRVGAEGMAEEEGGRRRVVPRPTAELSSFVERLSYEELSSSLATLSVELFDLVANALEDDVDPHQLHDRLPALLSLVGAVDALAMHGEGLLLQASRPAEPAAAAPSLGLWGVVATAAFVRTVVLPDYFLWVERAQEHAEQLLLGARLLQWFGKDARAIAAVDFAAAAALDMVDRWLSAGGAGVAAPTSWLPVWGGGGDSGKSGRDALGLFLGASLMHPDQLLRRRAATLEELIALHPASMPLRTLYALSVVGDLRRQRGTGPRQLLSRELQAISEQSLGVGEAAEQRMRQGVTPAHRALVHMLRAVVLSVEGPGSREDAVALLDSVGAVRSWTCPSEGECVSCGGVLLSLVRTAMVEEWPASLPVGADPEFLLLPEEAEQMTLAVQAGVRAALLLGGKAKEDLGRSACVWSAA